MPVVERPKAKRLRAGKAHRTALLESLVEEQRPIAEQVVLGGLPAVRQAIEKQNAERTAAGEPAIAAGPLLEMAEKLVPKVRAAEWRDRAEAAQRDLEVLDLRDLRSVVSAADSAPQDEESRELAQALKRGPRRPRRRRARGLARGAHGHRRGRPHRPGAAPQLPPAQGRRPAARPSWPPSSPSGAGAALTADAAPERWVAVLDALAFAPVRDKVIPDLAAHGDAPRRRAGHHRPARHPDPEDRPHLRDRARPDRARAPSAAARRSRQAEARRSPSADKADEPTAEPDEPTERPRSRAAPSAPSRSSGRSRARSRSRGRARGRDRRARAGAEAQRGRERLSDSRGVTTESLARAAPVVAARGVLVPAGAAGRAGARVEAQRREVEALHLVGLAERAPQVPAARVIAHPRQGPRGRTLRG